MNECHVLCLPGEAQRGSESLSWLPPSITLLVSICVSLVPESKAVWWGPIHSQSCIWAAEVGVRRDRARLSTLGHMLQDLGTYRGPGEFPRDSKKVKRRGSLSPRGGHDHRVFKSQAKGTLCLDPYSPGSGQSLHSGWGPCLPDRVSCDKTFPEKTQTQVYSPQTGHGMNTVKVQFDDPMSFITGIRVRNYFQVQK